MDDSPHYRPLYRQVYDFLVRQIAEGAWRPAEALPSEQALAEKLRVSQGTVRKALDAMTAENLLVRRQGRGTFVAEPEDARILFQFFRLTDDNGADDEAFPDSRLLSCTRAPATESEAEALAIKPGDDVWRIERSRQIRGRSISGAKAWISPSATGAATGLAWTRTISRRPGWP